MREAVLFKPLEKRAVRCLLCAQRCRVPSGERGLCGVRENTNGTLYTLVDDMIAASAIDPIEKKPLYHVLPQSHIFSVGTAGCNFACRFCQNAHLAAPPQKNTPMKGKQVSAQHVVEAAVQHGCNSVAFTYNEPTIFTEQICKIADLAQQQKLLCCLVSNGYQTSETLELLAPRINAANIDLKAFRDDFYKHYCRARLQPVLDNLKYMKKLGWWIEVTTLLIPDLNDDPVELRELAQFIRDELGSDVPWHISAFRPCHHMQDHRPTSAKAVLAACELGYAEGLHFVYPGNVATACATRCPHCKNVFIERRGWQINVLGTDAHCSHCNAILPGLWTTA